MIAHYAVVGDPVAHSLSPLIHTGWMKAAGLAADYERIRIESEDAAPAIRSLAASHAGLNVTLPHKLAALAAAEEASSAARAIGAANTLARRPSGGWAAYNTDVDGFLIALEAAGARLRPGLNVLLIGAGGAARAAMHALAAGGAAVSLCNRTLSRAEELARALAPRATLGGLEDLARLAGRADIVVNSASLGHAGEALPGLPPGGGRPFLDLSYGRAAAGALEAASRAGWTPHDGLPMLVGQAAAAFRIWFGIDPDQPAALQACREAVAARS